ncbi:MAG: hypothetical protein GWN25_02340, partial [Actinobacteria bacterium]|nr:hypothetical protein [Actinomycetota bacterium]
MTSDTTWRERALEHLQSKDPRLVGLALPMAQRALALTPDNPAAHMLVARCH